MRPTMRSFAVCIAGITSFLSILSAQGAYAPLSLQGLDRRTVPDIRSEGMGGTVIAAGNNAAVLFANPAGLTAVKSFELRLSGNTMSVLNKQTQRWVPNRYFTGLSLLMEDSWGNIKSPMLNDTTPVTDQWEQLQKPFDAIGPNWSRTSNASGLLSAVAAMPLTFDDLTIVFGLGAAQTADLNYYFQNNNVTDPLLGQYRPAPLRELQSGDTLRARWYQSILMREGNIWGITPAIGLSYGAFSVGLSATYYSGTSDDSEQRKDRGFLTFLYNRFKVQDTVRFTSTTIGSSDYSGLGVTLGFRITKPAYTIGAAFQLPYTLTREYSGTYSSYEEVLIKRAVPPLADSLRATVVNTTVKKTDKVSYPLSYSIGVLLKPFERWTFAFDVESRQLNNAEVSSGTAPAVKPWLSSPSFSLGAEYRWEQWLAFRCGYREVAEVFEPAGAALIGEPARRSAYTAGIGLLVESITLDLAYEYMSLRYQDLWQSNINQNGTYQHGVMAEIGFQL
jgi:opacity protein-like surface antigen